MKSINRPKALLIAATFFIFFTLNLALADDEQTFEDSEGLTNLVDCPSVLTNLPSGVTDGDWRWEPYNSDYTMCRNSSSYGEVKHGSYGIKITVDQPTNAGPHIRYEGDTNKTDFYQACWLYVVRQGATTFGSSGGAACKFIGSRPASGENELMIYDDELDNTKCIVYMSDNIGGYTYKYPFWTQNANDPASFTMDAWHYIKIRQTTSGLFDLWIDNVHVPYVNVSSNLGTARDGDGSWVSLPTSSHDLASVPVFVWYFLNYSGGGPQSDMVYYMDDLYFGAADPGYPGYQGGSSSQTNRAGPGTTNQAGPGTVNQVSAE